jgi:catechol 2,3-dioxygenase-like lactoylglutathione lyase family enzyme
MVLDMFHTLSYERLTFKNEANMIGYVTIGTNDVKRAMKFYDAALEPLGYRRKFEDGGWAGYGIGGKDGEDTVYLAAPHNKLPATHGNGSMIAFKAKSRGEVEAFHQAALAAGGLDEGAPGVRGTSDPTFYGAYARDPDGNKICAYFKG